MKRLFPWSFVITATCTVAGCYDGHDEHGCVADVECAPGYVCDLVSHECRVSTERCVEPTDCGTNETCGSDRVCRVGDCSFHGCAAGFSCQLVDVRYSCVEISDATESHDVSGAGGAAGAGGAKAGGAPAAAGSGS